MVETRSGKMQDPAQERIKAEESAKPQPEVIIGIGKKNMIRLSKNINTKTCLMHYSQDLSLYVTCDASNYGIGGYISNIVNGIEKPITFVSRTLNDKESVYSLVLVKT
ncbi:hypothetical protein LAZ67_3000912 [Cordylochernes scorpioides]|uniref:Reverse transcriptase/retrotransposon-derived protein RNase H-like domain-containing protein n=1 Tax=Cordylochernes scorpioides TaxID=51811 RepID=A0ABY6K6I2_9ARAC|nr:hypothetical protein LAZ67_3000912 [Cordylochernes scorpioides]